MKVWQNGPNFICEVPADEKHEIPRLMAYRGLQFSVSASSRDRAVLFSSNPYALADLANEDTPDLIPYAKEIEASRAEQGTGTHKLPPGKELWDYQKATLDYLLARGGGINADQPGLGKTPVSIAFCNHMEAMRVLVICPASVRLQWGERIKEWSTIPNVLVSVVQKSKDGIHPTANYVVLSYDIARNIPIMRAIAQTKWDVLICDEAHKMKSIDALTTRAILGNNKGDYLHRGIALPAIANHARYRLALTGTPLLNRPSEAYTLLRFFDHESIDYISWEAFKSRYNRQSEIRTVTGKRVFLESTSLETELQNRMRANIMARHEKNAVFKQMRPPRFSLVRVNKDRAVKEAVQAENLLDLDIEEIPTTNDFEVLGHIAEVRRQMGEAICPQVIDYTNDLLEGGEDKLVVFAWHRNVMDLLQEGLSKWGVARVDGSMSPKARQNAVDSFIKRDDIRIFLGNLIAAGVGLDGLQNVCSHCLIAEPDWVPTNNEQAVSRLDRLGQENLVHAEIFVAPGSISEKILVKALEKLNVIHRVLDEKEGSRNDHHHPDRPRRKRRGNP